MLYANREPRNDRQSRLFRSRLPHANFLELTEDISRDSLFKRWLCNDIANDQSNDIKLLLLESLRYLGRGWTFDNIGEITYISLEIPRQFFNAMIKFESTVLYNRHVTSTDVSTSEELFQTTDFDGCIGSSDTTHIGMLSYSIWVRINHLGYKLNIPSRTYNTTVSYCGQKLGTTSGHPSTWNGKTIIYMMIW